MSIQTDVYFPFLLRPNCPQGHLHLLPTSPTQAYFPSQTLSSLFHGLHRSTCPYGHFLFTDTAKQAFSSTQTLSSFFRGLYRPTRPRGHFLASPMAHTGQLVHTYVFFPPLQPAQAYLTTQTLSFYYHSLR